VIDAGSKEKTGLAIGGAIADGLLQSLGKGEP
jgi:hypothetical protein